MKTLTLSGMLTFLILSAINMEGQVVCVAGKIFDKITGESIKQLSVVERNSGIGTISSENGVYSLFLKPGKVDLSFFDDKYEMFSTAFILKSDTTINIPMKSISVDNTRKAKKDTAKHEVSSQVAVEPRPGKN